MARFWQNIATGEVIGNEDFLTLSLNKQEKFMETTKKQTHKLKATKDGSLLFETNSTVVAFSPNPQGIEPAKPIAVEYTPKAVEIIEPKVEEIKNVPTTPSNDIPLPNDI